MEDENLSCCFTGYRPQKFPFKLLKSEPQYIEFENLLFSKITELINNGCYTFYSGMAMGFDIIAAESVLLAAKVMENFPVRLICAIPFLDQAKKFPPEWRERYNSVLKCADSAVLISDKYYSGCYFDRNRFMVDNSDFVLTWFDGNPGGTKNTVEYAKTKGRKVINLYTGCDDVGNYN